MKGREGFRRALVAFVLLGGVGVVFALGAGVVGVSGPGAAARWLSLARGPWALPAAVASFAGLAFLGVPQFALIAAAVAAFGPEKGAAYSWIGTLVSSLIGYAIGRAAGTRIMAWASLDALDRFTALTRRHGADRQPGGAAGALRALRHGQCRGGSGGGDAAGFQPRHRHRHRAQDRPYRLCRRGRAQGAWAGEGGSASALLLLAAAIWIGAGLLARRWMKR